ncbi:MAG: hypothetical protein GC201_02910 [Alphaproteobacteria bacterium]|nr:hypothetical protein [Alphaproteobacteria bacterium]
MARKAKSSFVDPTRGVPRGLRDRLRNAYYGTFLYRRVLKGVHPVQIKFNPKDHWGGDVAVADALFRGQYRFAGYTVNAPNENPWRLRAPSQAWLDELHGFGWLRHFRAQGGDAAKRHVEALIKKWLQDYQDWDPVAWQPEVIAYRLIAWMSNASMAVSTQDLVHHSAVMNSMARQARHLSRTAATARDGLPKLIAVIGLVYSGFCLPEGARRMSKGLQLLERELGRQVLADGCIVTRNPSEQFEALRALVALKADLRAANQDVPNYIQRAIDRMAPMLRFFRLGDGKLALFNGSFEESEAEIDQVLAAAKAQGKPLGGAIYSGFQRVQAGQTILLMDAGSPPPGDLSVNAHAGLNSFEMSVGADRLITNCGSSDQMTAEGWHKVSRTTAAHSTLIIDNKNSFPILENHRIGKRPKKVLAVRDEMDDTVALDITHYGYVQAFGYEHERILKVARSGKQVEGIDALKSVNRKRRPKAPFDIRFHLPPGVDARRTVDGGAVELTLPGGAQWRFESTHGVNVEESVYMGERGHLQRSRQLVVSGTTGAPHLQVNWRLLKV